MTQYLDTKYVRSLIQAANMVKEPNITISRDVFVNCLLELLRMLEEKQNEPDSVRVQRIQRFALEAACTHIASLLTNEALDYPPDDKLYGALMNASFNVRAMIFNVQLPTEGHA